LWAQSLDSAANNLAAGMFTFGLTSDAGAVQNSASVLTDPQVDITIATSGGGVYAAEVATNATHNIRLNVFVGAASGVTNTAGVLRVDRYPLYKGTITTTGASVFNFADYIDEIQVNVNLVTNSVTDNTFVATVISHRLNLTDVSVPTDSNSLVDRRANTNSVGNPNDVLVVQPHNYGLRLDGKGNPVSEAGLQLNGHDRFDPRLGGYFNYVQPHQHHKRTPADGVNVYSFGLHPETHQPSGTCNLSRIDNASLILKLSDPLRNVFGKASSLTVDVSNSKLWCFAFSYNILRIMSGMGGVAYSN
jgi:hypothetical protein